ncbi:uncharacterized protein LOC131952253 [Physella acuta]|uniref:uncharacterized protein LOC131952253 n=1 Tax=Physella acuta TaxID=109671 RepID=UPI0027DDE87F|nr:uncharacterized protein LOC131952253 [Physella acuta]
METKSLVRHNYQDLQDLIQTYDDIHQTVEVKHGHLSYVWMESNKNLYETTKALEMILSKKLPAGYEFNHPYINFRSKIITIAKKFNKLNPCNSVHWHNIVSWLEKPYKMPPAHVKDTALAKSTENEVPERLNTEPRSLSEKQSAVFKRKFSGDEGLVEANKKLKAQLQECKRKLEKAKTKVKENKRLNQKIKKLRSELEKQRQLVEILKGSQQFLIDKLRASYNDNSSAKGSP